MQRTREIAKVILALLPVACGSSKDVVAEAAPIGTQELPLCGANPAQQPDRCVDEKGAIRCRVDSGGYQGDELALCQPDPEEGFLIHFGPKDYSNPEEVAKYTIPPGGEAEICLRVNTPNREQKFFNSYHGRMRPNSHHLIVTMPAKHYETEDSPWPCGPQVTERWLFGSQDPEIDVGVGADPALPKEGDPDFGLAHDVPPNQTLLMDFHNVNTGDTTQLRESWTTMMYTPPEEVKVRADLIAFYNVAISIPPLAHQTTSRVKCEVPASPSGEKEPVYVNLVSGHAHQRLQRLSVWHDLADGQSDLVYETHDWYEPGNALYRDGVDNPTLPIKESGSSWGATSGYLKVMPGETISFECEFQNDLNQVVTIGETSKDEMCNVFGNYFPSAGGMWNCFGR